MVKRVVQRTVGHISMLVLLGGQSGRERATTFVDGFSSRRPNKKQKEMIAASVDRTQYLQMIPHSMLNRSELQSGALPLVRC